MDHETVAQALIRERGKLRAYIWSLVRDVQVAEDLFQDVCLLAIRECKQIQNDSHLMRWSRRVARQRAIDWLRRDQRGPLLLDGMALDFLEAEWAREDSVVMVDLVDALRHCLEGLSARSRQLVKLRYVDGLSASRVADTLNRNVEAVYQALWRVHRALGKCVEKQMAQD